MKSVNFTYRDSHDGAQVDFYLSVPETARQGIFKISPLRQRTRTRPVCAGRRREILAVARGRPESLGHAAKDARGHSPGVLNGLNSVLSIANATAQQKNPDFDVRKYLLDNLGDDWMSYQKTPKGKTLEELNSPPSFFLFAAVNPDQAVLAIKNLASLGSSQDNATAPRNFRAGPFTRSTCRAVPRPAFTVLRHQRRLYRPDFGRFHD